MAEAGEEMADSVEAEETTPLASDSDVAGPHGIPQGESDTDSFGGFWNIYP